MECAPSDLPWQSVYKLLIGAVVPRPIGWISTVNLAGRPNLAPYSFFNVVCPNPPHVLFCPSVRAVNGRYKDSFYNARDTGEFVANIVSEALAPAMNITATDFPPEVNEFEAAGLQALPSVKVRPPRVAGSRVQLECQVAQIVTLGEGPGSGAVVIGRVVYLHIADELLPGGDRLDLDILQPVGRLGGHWYTRVTDRFEMLRPPSQIR